jgi:predicted dehydrogenase
LSSILALNAGKPVLCEKPFTLNAKEAEEVVRVARERKLFLMEAMWSRYFPAMVKMRALIGEGAIGEVLQMDAQKSYQLGARPAHIAVGHRP